MVYHSVPTESKMPNHEFTRFDISKVIFSPDSSLIDHMEATMTTFVPHEVDLTRTEIITNMAKGDGFYLDRHRLLLERVNGIQFIHLVTSEIPRDILK